MVNKNLMNAANRPQMMTSAYNSQTSTDATPPGVARLSNMNVQQLWNQGIQKMAEPKQRLIRVIIVDPDERVPLDKCILYSGEEKLTDLTDQELFFEIEIKSLLDAHNTTRSQIVDKTVKERTENLEPIKVRDLRMVVVTVAQF